jgi:hypothetical protein
MDGALDLLPRPWRVTPGDGAFSVDAGTRLQVSGEAAEATLHTTRGLQRALAASFGLVLDLVPTGSPAPENAVSLVVVGRDATTFPAETFGWAWSADLGPQGYALRVTPDGAVVAAEGEAGLFYGVQTLVQLAKLTGRSWPALAIEDRPVLPVRGLMLDVSRMKVPTLDTLTDLVRTLAHHKYNQFQLYTEHTFRFPRHPAIGADAGSLTGDDILALDAVCRAHHVELVPNLQSLGHQRAMLDLPAYGHLAETPWNWSLATGREETFELLDELYGDLLPAFSSRWLNVDADEPWDMGRGQSARLTDELGIGRVYLRHIERLHALAAKHGRRMMMWADMFWHHPDLIPELPEDILLLDWWYERKERYETVDALAEAGRRFYVCPGTSSWSSLFPRLENAIANIRGFVRDGVAAGAEGMLLTDWGDGGHYQPLSQSRYPYLWGAECAWTGGATESAAFDAAFDRLFLGDGAGVQTAALRRLGAAMQVDPQWTVTWNSAMALFEDPLAGPLAPTVSAEAVDEARAAAEAIFPLLDRVRDAGLRHDLGFTAAQIRFATEKVELARAVRALLAELATTPGAPDQGRERFDALLAAMRRQREALPAMVKEFEERWLAHARRSEIRVNLDRFAGLIARYDAALAWLEGQRGAYLDGRRVDADLRTYDRGNYAVLFQEALGNVQRLIDIIGVDALPPDLRGWLPRLEAASADPLAAG